MGYRKNVTTYALGLIILLASALRLIKLDTYPPSLYWEEAALGYDAYSLLTTTKDFHGQTYPLVAFESFGDYKPSGYFYAAIPFIYIFGLNEWGVRLPSAIAGIITVWFTIQIAYFLTKNRRVALLSGLVLAILPWHIQFSRAGFEVNLATCFLTMGIYLWLKSSVTKWLVLPSVICLIASMYTYHALRVMAPLVGLGLFSLSVYQYRLNRWIVVAGIMAMILVWPLLLQISSIEIQQRFKETGLFTTSDAVRQVNLWREEDGNTFFSRLWHHRYWYWGKEVVAGMISHFSPGFLWLTGDNNPRHQTGYKGLLYLWTLLPLGYLIVLKRKQPGIFFLLIWIILATIPAALTNLTPHTLRFLPAAPAIAILIGLGLVEIKHNAIRFILATLMIIEGGAYVYDYTHGYPIRTSRDWQYGYKQVVEFISRPEYADKQVFMTRAYGRPSIYVLFFSRYDPKLIQQAPHLLKDQGELLEFDRYHFGIISGTETGIIINNQPIPQGNLVKTITFLDGQPAFYIYEQ